MKLLDIIRTLASFGEVVEALKGRDAMIESWFRREVKDLQWRLQLLENHPDERRRRNTVIEQGGLANPYRYGVPAQIDPAGKIEPSVAPDVPPQAATQIQAKSQDQSVPGKTKASFKTSAIRPRASDALTFYEQLGGYTVVSRLTELEPFVQIDDETHRALLRQQAKWRFQFFTAPRKYTKRKSKMFHTRLQAEQFAFDVLKIHEAQCIARNKPTDWWNRVTIFEEIKR